MRILIGLSKNALLIPPKILAFFLVIFAPIANFTGKYAFRLILFPVYLSYRFVKTQAQKIFRPVKASFWAVFFTRYIVHGFIFILVIFVTTQNIFAQGNEENLFSGNVIIAQVFKGKIEGETIIEDAHTSFLPQTKISGSGKALGNVLSSENIEAMDSEKINTNEISSTSTVPVALGVLEEESEIESTARTEIEEYIVQPGDVVSIIAEKFGISPSTVLWANNLNNYSLIKPGDKLRIPPVSGVVHSVKKGDTIEKIASRYKVDAEKIVEYNKLVDENDINIDESLIIPGGKMPEPPKPAPRPTSRSFALNIFSAPAPAKVEAGSRMQWPGPTRKINQYYRGWLHTGLDIDCNYGQAVYAANDGVVVRSGWTGGYGLNVMINHGGGMQTLYGHNQKNLVRVGQRVSKGEAIAMCGSTGRSTGTHIHFEVLINGAKQNPLKFL